MVLTQKEIKKRHFDKVYKNAKIIDCACGCGTRIKSKDKYARDVHYVNGHNGRKYKDPTQYKREWNKRNREQRTEYRKEQRHKRKGKLIEYKGGICSDCGLVYNKKNGSVFDFHHLRDKKFGISGNTMEMSLEKLKKEADKCTLLCSNCHRIRHSEDY